MTLSLHPRNRHRGDYDFTALQQAVPELSAYLVTTPDGRRSLDFSRAEAVKCLNRALLKCFYRVDFWDIPETYLCPPVPGRVDYLHYLADLLAEDNEGDIPTGRRIRVLDIGCGANLIYPLVGSHEYSWQFCASDIDPVSVKVANQLSQFNKRDIKVRLQKDPQHIFKGIIGDKDLFHLTLCNPPFHASAEQAAEGTQRKWRNLGKTPSRDLNFGGQNAELWCPGGERAFVGNMIKESVQFKDKVLWFSSLVSKNDNVKPLLQQLSKHGATETRVVAMAQGQKQSRFIAWSFFGPEARRELLKG